METEAAESLTQRRPHTTAARRSLLSVTSTLPLPGALLQSNRLLVIRPSFATVKSLFFVLALTQERQVTAWLRVD